jgi:hypothetical protein
VGLGLGSRIGTPTDSYCRLSRVDGFRGNGKFRQAVQFRNVTPPNLLVLLRPLNSPPLLDRVDKRMDLGLALELPQYVVVGGVEPVDRFRRISELRVLSACSRIFVASDTVGSPQFSLLSVGVV